VIKQVFFTQIAVQNSEKMQFAAVISRSLPAMKEKTKIFDSGS